MKISDSRKQTAQGLAKIRLRKELFRNRVNRKRLFSVVQIKNLFLKIYSQESILNFVSTAIEKQKKPIQNVKYHYYAEFVVPQVLAFEA